MPNCSILLHSCLVGEGGINEPNFANSLADNLPGHTIYGAEKSIERGELFVIGVFPNEKDNSLSIFYQIDPSSGYDINEFLH